MKRLILLAALVLGVLVAPQARADKYALLIGIDQYRESDFINPLSAAGADAVALGKTLVEVAGFPADHVNVLTSGGDSVPSRGHILHALDILAREVKPGDLVFVFYSGHGWSPKDSDVSYLLPYDTDPTSEFMLKESTIPTTIFVKALQHLPAQAVVMAFDMCRNNPFKEQNKAMGTTEKLGAQQARDLTLVPSAAPGGLHAAVTLFSCSVDEKSWEWSAKKRGFFSYYLEQALRNSNGASVDDVVRYVEKQVPSAVRREQNQAQTPWVDIKGSGALDLLLTPRRSTPGANPQPNNPVSLPVPDPVVLGTSAKLKVVSTPSGAKVYVDGVAKGVTPLELEVDLDIARTRQVEVGVKLNGYKTLVEQVTLTRGASTPLSLALERLPQPVAPQPVGPQGGQTRINLQDGKPKLYILAIGVSDYQDKDLKLDFAAKDAQDFTAALLPQKGGLYADISAKVLTDTDATRDNIMKGLDWIQHQTTIKDVAMVFFSGHGYNTERERYYFIPSDFDRDHFRSTTIPFSVIQNTIQAIAGKALFFVDSCHSGNVMGSKDSNDITGVINELSSAENGAMVFSASTGSQFSWEDPKWGNGAFTKALVEGLKGAADYHHNGRITVNMLDLYISERVKELTSGKQTPIRQAPPTMPDFTVVAPSEMM
jgi:uncharacterized caspase-like protein